MRSMIYLFGMLSISAALIVRGGEASPRPSVDEVSGPHADSGADGGKEFKFSLDKDTYCFVCLETGKKGKGPLEVGVIPMDALHIRANAPPEKWELSVRVWADPQKNVQQWKIKITTTGPLPDGRVVRQTDNIWRDTPLNQSATAESEILLTDLMKKEPVKGFRMSKISYATVNGEPHYVLVAIGDNVQHFKDTIQIPKVNIFWTKWDNWLELPSQTSNTR